MNMICFAFIHFSYFSFPPICNNIKYRCFTLFQENKKFTSLEVLYLDHGQFYILINANNLSKENNMELLSLD